MTGTAALDADAAAAVAAVRTGVDGAFDEMVDTRRDLHAHPELSMAETRTTGIVRERLASLGLTEACRPTATGAVFDLEGGRPGRTVVLRADIDALPVTETVDVPYRSGADGCMHACGHDVHTAALLGVARVLAARAGGLPGRFRFLFQPAEEAICGARAMLAGGALQGVGPDARLLGFHVASVAPTGMVGVRAGVAMAEVHSLQIVLRGTGGHGAMPTEGGNVVLAAARLVRALAGTVAGLAYEGTPCVCSAGVLRAGTARNVVPDRAVVEGTLRTFTDRQRADALTRLEALCAEVAEAEGVTVDCDVVEHCAAVVNDPGVTDLVAAVAGGALGADHVLRMGPVSPSDDVSELLAEIGGCYFFVGGALPDGTSGVHHCPTFAVDEESLRVGATVLAASAVALAATPGAGAPGTEG